MAAAELTGESRLTGPGGPYELVHADGPCGRVRVFRHAPATLPEFLSTLAGFSDRRLLVCELRRLSYGQVFAHAAGVAHELRRRGVARGSRIVIAMRNSPECVVAIIAALAIGAVPVLVNSRGARAEILDCVRMASCAVVLADARCAVELNGTVPAGVTIIEESALASIAPRDDFFANLASGLAPDDPAVILFTSGTAGRAKAAVLTHRGVITSIWANLYAGALIGLRLAQKLGLDVATLAAQTQPSCLLLVYPLFHTSGLHSGLLATLARGARFVMMKRWTGSGALHLIEAERITQIPGVPAMFWDMLQVPERRQFDLSSLSSISTGGQAMPVNLLADLQAEFPRALFGNGYGLTEANGAVSVVVGEDFLARPATSGTVLSTLDVRFMRDAHTEAAPGEPGEICVRGASVMREYFEDPAATAAALRDGWLHTGDIGYVDAEGFLYIVDRKKDMIISAGENIYCAEVERVLVEHPSVLEASTFGVADARLGEKLVAVVVPRNGCCVTEAETQQWAGQRLAAYKVPHHVWISKEPLVRNDLGKVDKIVLRQRFAQFAKG